MSYLPRIVDAEFGELVDGLAACVIQGARGVGKTSTAERIAAQAVYLDDETQRAIYSAELDLLADLPRPVLIDEWQRLPPVWDKVRRWVDRGAPPGSFLLTGSSYPRGAEVHPGAGRIARLRMRPLSLAERQLMATPTVSLDSMLRSPDPIPIAGSSPLGLREYVAEITATGLPGLRGLPERLRRAQLDGYVDDLVNREFPDQGHTVRRPATLLAWLRAYAAATSSTAGYTSILNAATAGEDDKPAKTTTIQYRDVLSSLWLLDELPPWLPHDTPLRRLARSPKHRLLDPGVAAFLLGVGDAQLLDGSVAPLPRSEHSTLLGALFENLVSMSVNVYAQAAEAAVTHLRTQNGDHEIDLIVERAGRVIALETKLAQNASDADVKHLHWLKHAIGDRLADAVVVTTGPQAYRRQDGVAVVPAALLGP